MSEPSTASNGHLGVNVWGIYLLNIKCFEEGGTHWLHRETETLILHYTHIEEKPIFKIAEFHVGSGETTMITLAISGRNCHCWEKIPQGNWCKFTTTYTANAIILFQKQIHNVQWDLHHHKCV